MPRRRRVRIRQSRKLPTRHHADNFRQLHPLLRQSFAPQCRKPHAGGVCSLILDCIVPAKHTRGRQRPRAGFCKDRAVLNAQSGNRSMPCLFVKPQLLTRLATRGPFGTSLRFSRNLFHILPSWFQLRKRDSSYELDRYQPEKSRPANRAAAENERGDYCIQVTENEPFEVLAVAAELSCPGAAKLKVPKAV